MKQECLYRFCEERHALYFKGSFSQCLSNNLLPWSMTCVTRLRLKNIASWRDSRRVACSLHWKQSERNGIISGRERGKNIFVGRRRQRKRANGMFIAMFIFSERVGKEEESYVWSTNESGMSSHGTNRSDFQREKEHTEGKTWSSCCLYSCCVSCSILMSID